MTALKYTPSSLLAKAKKFIEKRKKEKKMVTLAGLFAYLEIDHECYRKYKRGRIGTTPDRYIAAIAQIEQMIEDETLCNERLSAQLQTFYLKNKFNYVDKLDINQTNLEIELSEDEKKQYLLNYLNRDTFRE